MRIASVFVFFSMVGFSSLDVREEKGDDKEEEEEDDERFLRERH